MAGDHAAVSPGLTVAHSIAWATIALSVLCTLDQATRGPSLTALVIQNYFC